MAAEAIDIDMKLRHLRSFFAVTDTDPFEGEGIDESGIDQLIGRVTAISGWRRRPISLRLHVPASPENIELIPRMGEALVRYCDIHRQFAERKLMEIRREGMRTLAVGMVFLALCIGLAALIETTAVADMLIGELLTEGAIIAGWVGLWRPIEILLFDWWPYARDRMLYGKLRDLKFIVLPDATMD